MPAVSQGLQTPITAAPAAKTLQLLGPPPRTRASPMTSGIALQPYDEPRNPLKNPPETAAVSTGSRSECLGVASDPWRRLNRVRSTCRRSQFEFYERRNKKRAIGAGSGGKAVNLLLSTTTDFSQATSVGDFAANRRRDPEESSFPADVPGEVWWVQRPKGGRADDVDLCPCFGCRCHRRLLCYKGVFGPGCVGFRAKCIRCGRLGPRICALFFDGGPASSPVSGEDAVDHRGRETFCSPYTTPAGIYQPCLPQGDRCVADQATRDKIQEDPAWRWKDGRRLPQSQTSPEVPEEGEGDWGGAIATTDLETEFNATPEVAWFACGHQRDLDGRLLDPAGEGDRASRPLGSPSFPGVGGCGSSKPRRLPKGGSSGPVQGDIRQLSFPTWCSKLTTLVLRSRTAFASFVSFSIRLTRSSSGRAPASPTLFPVPPPCTGCFDRMPTKVSSSKRRAVNVARAVHVICVALNFWHSDGSFPGAEAMWRVPSALHRALYKRIRAFIKSDGLNAVFDSLHVGRKNPELFARLNEVTEMLTTLGCSASPYSKLFTGYEVTRDNAQFPELEPYRDLDPQRLILFGRGHWDVTSFLSDELVMAYTGNPRQSKLLELQQFGNTLVYEILLIEWLSLHCFGIGKAFFAFIKRSWIHGRPASWCAFSIATRQSIETAR